MVGATWQTDRGMVRETDVVTSESRSSVSRASNLNPDAPEFEPGRRSDSGRQRTGPLILHGRLEGEKVQFLSDTGAEVTVISLKCYETLPREAKQRFQDCASSISMPNGQTVVSKGPVLCRIEVEDRKINEVVYAADIEDYALLGWDAQLALGVTYTVAGVDLVGTRRLRHVYNPVVRHVRVAEDVTIPARSQLIVRGEWPSGLKDSIVMVSDHKGFGHGSGLVVARAVVNKQEGRCPVRVMNLNDEPRKLFKGDLVAGAEEVDELRGGSSSVAEEAEQLPVHLQEVYDRTVADGNLPAEVTGPFKQFLRKHAGVFAANDTDLGRTDLVQHNIDTGDALPIRQPPRRMPIAQQADCEVEIQSMLAKGVIERGQSPWASPVVLVRKKDGSLRFYVDYRRLNGVTKFDAYPLPRIDETLETLGGAKWFTTLDLISGYWQVGLTPEAKLKSAMCVRSGLYLWKVMPFGLCNAPSTFERLMDTVLAGLQWSSCLIYLDDVVIFGRTEQELLTRMDDVFTRLGGAGLKVKPRKCHFLRLETDYLGHVISGDGIRVSSDKVAAVRDWPVPRCVTEVRSFLGTASYYRRFVAGFATIAAPLHDLTRQGATYVWSDECQEAFDTLKEALCGAPVLAFPVPGAKFVLDTDASDRGIGAVLSQLVPVGTDADGEQVFDERVLSYASRTLNHHERNYCTTRKELLAVVWFMRHFRPYLYGQEFVVRTDHASLQWLCNFWEPEGQIARWLQIVGEYNYTVQHREGKKHGNADGLSRQGVCKQCKREVLWETDPLAGPAAPCPGRLVTRRVTTKVRLVTLRPEWTPNQLAAWQGLDGELEPVVSALKAGRVPAPDEVTSWPSVTKRLMLEYERLKLIQGVMYRVWYDRAGNEQRYQLVTPRRMRGDVLSVAHDGEVAGHYAERATVKKVRQHFYWPQLLSDVRHFCKSCRVCQQRRPPPRRPHHPLQQDRVGEPMQRVTIDILGFERPTPRGNRYILVAVDSLTKWAEAMPMPDERAETVARALVEQVVCRLGIPAQVHSDQGRQFEAQVFQEMCKLLGVRKTRTTPMHPQGDGQTERLNRTLLNLLAKLAADESQDWDLKLPYAMMAYRSTPHTTTGETPNRLMLGREATTPLRLLAPVTPDAEVRHPWVDDLHENFAEAHVRVQEQVGRAQRSQKQSHDRRQRNYVFNEGDKVWLLDNRPRKGTPYKLNAYRWRGPYDVRRKLSPAVFVLSLPGGRNTFVINADRLMPCVERRAELQPEMVAAEEQPAVQVGAQPHNGSDSDDEQAEIVTNRADGTDFLAASDAGRANELEVPEWTSRPRRARRRPARLQDCQLSDSDS